MEKIACSRRCGELACDCREEYFEQLQADFTELKETVQINCTPPDDCNDPVVLKTYMKACFEQANK